MQTFGEAKTSFIDVVQSSFASLAQMFGISQLKESFYQNIIYILIVIVIMIGILVYVQMVGIESKGPLFSPPTKEIKKVEIRRRIVEGFDANVDFGNKDIGGAALVNGGDDMFGDGGGDGYGGDDGDGGDGGDGGDNGYGGDDYGGDDGDGGNDCGDDGDDNAMNGNNGRSLYQGFSEHYENKKRRQ